MSNIIFDSLVNAKDDHTCIEILLKEKSGHLVGKIQDLVDGYLLLESIWNTGIDDGFIAVPIGEIYGVYIQTDYCKKLIKLYELKSQKHFLIPNNCNNIIFNLLNFSKNKSLMIEIDYMSGTEEYYAQGFISEFNDSFLVLKTIDNYAHIDGTTVIDISSVRILYCNGAKLRDLKLLYDSNFKIS